MQDVTVTLTRYFCVTFDISISRHALNNSAITESQKCRRSTKECILIHQRMSTDIILRITTLGATWVKISVSSKMDWWDHVWDQFRWHLSRMRRNGHISIFGLEYDRRFKIVRARFPIKCKFLPLGPPLLTCAET